MCLYKNNLYVPCGLSYLYRYCSFFIILSYSYLTLTEKQSSSAVTWASPGCHVFLKGCLRGTLPIESLLITCPMSLCIPYFLVLTCSPHTSLCNAVSLLLPFLPYCHVMFSRFQLAVKLFLNVKYKNNCRSTPDVHLSIIQFNRNNGICLTFTTQAETAQLVLHLNGLLYLVFQMCFFLFKSTPYNQCFQLLS